MAKKKTGLQKNISSIFEGTPLPMATEEPVTPPAEFPLENQTVPQPEAHDSHNTNTEIQKPPTLALPVQPPREKTKITKKKPVTRVKKNIQLPRFFEHYDSRQKKMLAMVAVLAVVFVSVLLRSFLPEKANPLQIASAAMPAAENLIDQQPAALINWQEPAKLASISRDPTQRKAPPSTQTTTQESFTDELPDIAIEGIVYSDENPAAIIENQILHEGEKIHGVTLLKITRNQVEFEYNGKHWTQEVF